MSFPHIDVAFWTAAIALVGGLCVAALTHQFNLRRERHQKRRELALTYKIEALRDLQQGCRNDRPITDKGPALERAVFNLQIFGTSTQIAKAVEFAAVYARGDLASATELLNDLRNDVRRELGLAPIPGLMTTLVVTPKHPAADTVSS